MLFLYTGLAFKVVPMLIVFYHLLSKHNRVTSRAKSQAVVLFEFPICRLGVQLQKVETDQGFTRWLFSSDVYYDVKRLLTEKEKERRKEEISKCSREWWFLV